MSRRPTYKDVGKTVLFSKELSNDCEKVHGEREVRGIFLGTIKYLGLFGGKSVYACLMTERCAKDFDDEEQVILYTEAWVPD